MQLNEIFGFGRKQEQTRRGKTVETAMEVVDLYTKGRLNYKEAITQIKQLAKNNEEYAAARSELMFASQE